MKEEQVYKICDFLKTKRGSFTRLVYEREIAPSAKYKGVKITKHVEMVCRAGIDYSNMAAVIERRAEAQPNAYIKTWDWVPGYEHFVKKNIRSGQLYVNFETVQKPNQVVKYTINGVPATEDEVRAITTASAWNRPQHLDTFDVKFENIIEIGGDADGRKA